MVDNDESLVAFLVPDDASAVVATAHDEEWDFVREIEPLADRFHEWIWRHEGTLVRLIYDHFVDVSYVAARGPRHAEIAERFQAALKGQTLTQSVARLGSADHNDRCIGVPLVGAMAPPTYDPSIFEALARLAKDPEDEVRRSLLTTISRIAWPELVPIVDDMQRDVDSDIAFDAKRLSSLLRSSGR